MKSLNSSQASLQKTLAEKLTPTQIAKLRDERILGPLLLEAATIARQRKRENAGRTSKTRLFQSYQDDPVGFGVDVLGEKFTPDVMRVMESVRDNPVTIARSANATGKSQPVDTPVLTPEGYRRIGSIAVGDCVIGQDGQPVLVTGVFPQGAQPTCRVAFNDGTSTLCSADHLWAVRSSSDKHRGRPLSVMTALDAQKILHRFLHIPLCAPVQFRTRELKIAPYVMGVLIGDGSLRASVRFDSADAFIVIKVQDHLLDGTTLHFYRKAHYGIIGRKGFASPIISALRQYGQMGKAAYEKTIPSDYMLGDVEQRRELLAGLMDTDGTIDRNGSVSYSTTSESLCRQFVELVNSLGGTAKPAERRTRYVITVKLSFCPFSLPSKAARWRDPQTMQKQAHRLIKSIDYVGEMDSVCIRVDSPSGLYLTEHCIVTHNTHSAARVAVWFYKCHPGAQVYTTAAPPEDNLRRLLWGEISRIQDKHKDLFADDRQLAMHIGRNGSEFITGVAIPMNDSPEKREARFSGKHAPYLLFIIDEGDAVPDEIYRAIEGCMSGGHARMLIMFNPRHEAGPVYRMERDKQANVVELSALTHPNVVEGTELYPGAVTRETTVRRINEMTRPLAPGERPDSHAFEVPTFLANVTARRKDGQFYPPLAAGWRKVEDPAFSYMTLGKYAAQGIRQLFSQEWIDAARSRWDAYVARFGERPPLGVTGKLGVDVADDGMDNNSACWRYGGWVPRLTVWNGVDVMETSDRVFDIVEQAPGKTSAVLVDANGVGAGVPPALRRRITRGVNIVKVKVAEKATEKAQTTSGEILGEFAQLRDQLWWAAREWLRTDPGAMLPPDEILQEELRVVTYDTDAKGRIKIMSKDDMKAKLRRSPDRADSLCLTFAPCDKKVLVAVI